MLTLFTTPPAWGLPSFSPFCAKLDAYMRMAEIPFKPRTGDIRKSPKGKIPWIDDDGRVLGDSSAIVDYLKDKHGDPLDGDLTPLQKSQLLLLQRTVEEHLYFAVAQLRWSSEVAKPHLKAAFAPLLPPIIGGLIMGAIRKSALKSAYAQGTGRHSDAEILDRLRRDLEAIATVLGDQPYFFGETPTSFDAIAYGFLQQILQAPWDSAEKTLVQSFGTLIEFVERVQDRYYAS